MDDTAKLLTEVRDLLQRHLELATSEAQRAARTDEERKAMNEQALAAQRAGMRFYRRVVLLSAPVLLLLLVVLGVAIGAIWTWASQR